MTARRRLDPDAAEAHRRTGRKRGFLLSYKVRITDEQRAQVLELAADSRYIHQSGRHRGTSKTREIARVVGLSHPTVLNVLGRSPAPAERRRTQKLRAAAGEVLGDLPKRERVLAIQRFAANNPESNSREVARAFSVTPVTVLAVLRRPSERDLFQACVGGSYGGPVPLGQKEKKTLPAVRDVIFEIAAREYLADMPNELSALRFALNDLRTVFPGMSALMISANKSLGAWIDSGTFARFLAHRERHVQHLKDCGIPVVSTIVR